MKRRMIKATTIGRALGIGVLLGSVIYLAMGLYTGRVALWYAIALALLVLLVLLLLLPRIGKRS
ncbi:hypothetical protein [Spirosoma gilvum]